MNITELQDLLKLRDEQLAAAFDQISATGRSNIALLERAERAEEQRDRLLKAFDESLDRERSAAKRASDAIREQEEAAGL